MKLLLRSELILQAVLGIDQPSVWAQLGKQMVELDQPSGWIEKVEMGGA